MEGRKRSRNGIDAVAQASNAFSIADWRPTQDAENETIKFPHAIRRWRLLDLILALESERKPLLLMMIWLCQLVSATTLYYMMQFRSHSSRQRKLSLMTDQPMELWFGHFCMVLPRTLQIGHSRAWLSFFLIFFIIDRVRHTIHLFSLERIAPFYRSR